MKKTSYLSVFLIVFFFSNAGCQSQSRPGLAVENTQFIKAGRPFYGVGVNYFSALIRTTGTEGRPANLSDRSAKDGFQTLAKYEIPFVRFCAGGFFPDDWKLYFNDKEAYFQAFDRLVKDAREAGIGLIPSLFWYFPTVPDIVGEPVDQWGNPESKTHTFMKKYTTEVVTRYKDSPAIWAWEFGNEYLHECDLPDPKHGRGWTGQFGMPAKRTARDKMYRKNVYVAYRAFAEIVRSIDPYRAILSGDTMPRPGAYHLWKTGEWGMDSKEQWQKIFLQDNEAMDALSAHFYYYSQDEKHQDGGLMGYGPKEQIKFMMEISQAANKPLFLGEFGPTPHERTKEEECRQFESILNWIQEYDVPMAALWNFDFPHELQTHWNITDKNHRVYMLESLRKANRKIRGSHAEPKQND